MSSDFSGFWSSDQKMKNEKWNVPDNSLNNFVYVLTIWYWNMNRWSHDSSSHFATITPFGLSFWEMSSKVQKPYF
jgi:hypothetical protein